MRPVSSGNVGSAAACPTSSASAAAITHSHAAATRAMGKAATGAIVSRLKRSKRHRVRSPQVSDAGELSAAPRAGSRYFLVPKSTFGVLTSSAGMSNVAISL